MPLLYPDNLKHNNPNNPLMEVDQLKGYYNINLLTERNTIPLAKRSIVQQVVCKETASSYIYKGDTVGDVDWNNASNWEESSSIDICTQSDVEQTIPTENTKATSALRAWQGFVYWVKNTSFSGLNTTAKTVQGGINELAARKEVIYASQAEAVEAVETEKTMNPLRVGQHWSYAIANNIIGALNTSNQKIVGAINELKTAWDNVLIALDLKAMQNVGVCQKIPIYPEDLIIDPVALTFTIATVNRGQAITANNPIRVFTDGSGVIKKWEKYTPQTVTFTKTLGAWGVYFDNIGTLKCDQTVWADFATIAPIARFYINDQLANASMIEPNVWEAHLNDVSATAHKVMHFTTGTENISGFDIVSNILTPDANGRPTVAPNANGRNTVVSLTGGENSDDGLFYTVVNSTNNLPFNQDLGHLTSSTLTALNSGLFRVRKSDSSGRLAFNTATRFPFPWNSSNNRPQYVTELGVFTDVPDNRWIVNFIYSFQDWVAGRAVKVVSAHVSFATYNEALAYGWESIRNLYPTMRDQELRQLYKLIHYVDHSGGGSYPAGCKYAGLVSITDIRKSVQASITATGGATLASNVLLTPPTGYTSNNVQLGIEELAANTLKGNTTVHTTPIAADSIGILDSVAGLFKRIPLSSIKTFVLNGLTTTQVSNVSNVYGATVTDVLNAAPATQVDTVEDTDLFAGQRPSQFNIMVPWSAMKTQLCNTFYNVTTYQQILDILYDTNVSDTVVINLMNEITFGSALQTRAKNVIFRGNRFNINTSAIEISGYADGTYNITFENLVYSSTATSFLIGNSFFTTTLNINFNTISNLSYPLTGDGNLAFIKGSAGTTATVKYNAIKNIKINTTTNIQPTQSNMFFTWEYLYDISNYSASESSHFLMDRNGKITIRSYYRCKPDLDRTITLVPAIPVTMVLHDFVTKAKLIENALPAYTNGTETFNKFLNNSTPLAYSSTFSDLDDKLEYRNNTGNGSAQYTSTGGIVDISSSGLKLDLVYSGDGGIQKEIIITGLGFVI